MRRSALATVLVLVVACAGDRDCDPTSALPLVSVDVAALAPSHDLATLEVCLDERCVRPGDPTEPLLFGPEAEARFLVPDDEVGDDPVTAPMPTVLVRTETGEVLVPATPVELNRIYPNGEACGGDAWQGWFRATADGALVEVPDAAPN